MNILWPNESALIAGRLVHALSGLLKDCRIIGVLVAASMLSVLGDCCLRAQQPFSSVWSQESFSTVWIQPTIWKPGFVKVGDVLPARFLVEQAPREGEPFGELEPVHVFDVRPVSFWTLQPSREPVVNVVVFEPEGVPAPERSSGRGPGPQARSVTRELDRLKQRLEELETARVAHEDATRTIIRRTFSERGSNINDFVVFGGTFEMLTGWAEDFEGNKESVNRLDTAELDFEILVNTWTLGSIIFEYDDGTDLLFPTTEDGEAFVDRLNVDTAFVTIGDTQRCPIFTTFGRIIVPFGISTGDPVADVLTIDDPLTIEVFETREDAILIGFEIPTPPPPPKTPTTPTTRPLPVRPLLLYPVFRNLSRRFCRGLAYRPPTPTTTPTTVPTTTLPVTPPPFSGGIYFYNGDTTDEGGDHIEHIGGTLGYRTNGFFSSGRLPWSFDIDVDFNSSVFDSRFLEFEYRRFLDQIGYVPGMAAHVKSNVGPVSLVVEWNGALRDATFTDDLDEAISIAPSAWQISLGYQFDWNPFVEFIGAQGTYLAIGYSESRDLPGVTRVIDGEELRIGFVPEKRFLVSVGEWVLDGLRVAVEYAYIVDYSEEQGGTGNSAHAVFGMLTYEW